MILTSPTHLYLGLRPSGTHEYVNLSSGSVLFSDSPPDLDYFSPVDLDFSLDTPFTSRPREFLVALRLKRLELLTSRPSKTKGPSRDPNDNSPRSRKTPPPPGTTSRRSRKLASLDARVTSALKNAGLSEDLLRLLG